MQVLFESRDPQAHDLRNVAQRRMRSVFGRIDGLIPNASLQRSDVDSPRGGTDKRCPSDPMAGTPGDSLGLSTRITSRTDLVPRPAEAVVERHFRWIPNPKPRSTHYAHLSL